ncbi:MAG: zf-HC2 domain-containing protein [Deltaproteobacteria bacterium]|nr:MAG: zf-HC2 domain-containing protein [Deltaproteobacteria bacterium]
MKPCSSLQRMLEDRDVASLSQSEKVALEEHLASCSSCRDLHRYTTLTQSVRDHWTIPDISDDFEQRIMSQIADEPQILPWIEQWKRSRWFSIAAGTAFAMSFVLMVGVFSIPVTPSSSDHLVKQRLKLIQGPSFKPNKLSIAANALGLELD